MDNFIDFTTKMEVFMSEQIELMTILKELHNITKFRISVYDTTMKELCAYPQNSSAFCQLVQQNPKGKVICCRYDEQAFSRVKETGECYIYQCKFGLYEAVSPLYDFGVLSGYLMMGQTLDTLQNSKDYTLFHASHYVEDLKELEKTIKGIPLCNKEQLRSCITIMEVCAAYITMNNRLQLDDHQLPAKVKSYINKNYAMKLTIPHLCSIFFCSKATLTNGFRNAYSTSIHHYLTSVRISHAKELLRNKDLSIQYVGELCGYPDQNYFSKIFFKECKMTPSKYRSLH